MLYGTFLLADRKRAGFLFLLVGNIIWAYVGLTRNAQADLIAVSLIFGVIDIWGFYKWREPVEKFFDYDLFAPASRSPFLRNRNGYTKKYRSKN